MQSEDKRERWRKLVREYKESNQSKKEWCSEKKISTHVFGYWYSIFSATSQSQKKENECLGNDIVDNIVDATNKKETLSAGNWLEVQLQKEENKSNLATKKSIEIKIGKVEISISEGFDKDLFKEVVKVLGEI